MPFDLGEKGPRKDKAGVRRRYDIVYRFRSVQKKKVPNSVFRSREKVESSEVSSFDDIS